MALSSLVLALALDAGCTTPLPRADGGRDAGASDDDGSIDAATAEPDASVAVGDDAHVVDRDAAGRDAGRARDTGVGRDGGAACPPGAVDLDGDAANGCEYACTFVEDADVPDPTFADTNCDGIDGDVAHAIFVSEAGVDTARGSMSNPVRTIGHGLELAVAEGRDVYVDAGTYEESLELEDGVSIYGGFDRTTSPIPSVTGYWSRREGAVTRILGGPIAIEATGLTELVVLDRLTIRSADATGLGAPSICVWAHDSTGILRISGSTLVAGDGGDGSDRTAGTPGAPGGDASGRIGGTSVCGRTGGDGAVAMTCTPDFEGGARGEAGVGGAAGGAGATAATGTCPVGRVGGDGATRTILMGALAPSDGNATGSIEFGGGWVASDGGDGADGEHGGGGGGGGSGGCGGIMVGALCVPSPGGAGGGGGGGGCGGEGGRGGGGGGASFGVLAVDAPVRVASSDVTTGAGGDGGNGGVGGAGGSGGDGGAGIAGGTGGGTGGDGGRGQAGGAGRHGGGGGGGPSICLAHAGTATIMQASTALHPGLGGAGGIGAGGAAPSGASAMVREL